MEANELMIGDWVKISHLNKIGKVYRIDRANGKGNGFAAVIDGDYYEGSLEPIPITPEILEKNGFEEGKGGNFCRVLNIDEYKYVLYNFNDSFIYIRNEFYNMDVQIHYVHQLQQALRLCGIEKEIIL